MVLRLRLPLLRQHLPVVPVLVVRLRLLLLLLLCHQAEMRLLQLAR